MPLHPAIAARLPMLDGIPSMMVGHADPQMRARIMNALERMEEGAYGKCMRCGKDIPIDRLRAIPYAEYDVACQEIIDHQQAVRAGTA